MNFENFKGNDELLPVGLSLCALALYLATMAPGLTWGDSGEFITAAWTLGIGHPYGHPLYWLTGRLMTMFLPGNIVLAMNALSAISGAVTCYFIAKLTRDWIRRTGCTLVSFPVILATTIFATATAFWSQALFTEVYTFHALIFTIAFYTFDRYFFGNAGIRYLYLSAYFWGLTITLGMYAIIAGLIPLSLIIADRHHRHVVAQNLPQAIFWLAIGLTPWLYLYARYLAAPPLSVKSFLTLQDFRDYLGRREFDEIVTAGFGAFEISLKQTARIVWNGFHAVGIGAILYLWARTFRIRTAKPISTYILASILSILTFSMLIPLTLSFRQMIDMDVYFIPALIAFVPVIGLGLAEMLRAFPRPAVRILLSLLILAPVVYKYNSVSMAKGSLAVEYADYFGSTIPSQSKIYAVSDEVTQVLLLQIFCQGNSNNLTLTTQALVLKSDALGGLGAASLSDYIEIDEKFILYPALFDHSAIAGPFMSLRGATSESRQLEEEFVSQFSPDSAVVSSMHHYDRIFLGQTWARRGYYWLKRSNLPGITAEEASRNVDNSIVCYRQALLLDDYTFEGASHSGNLAIALIVRGRTFEAERFIDQGLKVNPRAEAPWRARLSLALKQEQHEAALSALKHLLDYSSNQAEIWIDMAALYFYKLNDKENAIHAYKNGLNAGGGRRMNLERALNFSPGY